VNTPLALRANDITVRIGRQALIEDVSLSLPVGSMTVLLGPNGAGKTTLLRVLAGVIVPTTGEVYLGESRIRHLGRSAIARRCAYLPQHTGATFDICAEDVVALGRYAHVGPWRALSRQDYEAIHQAMERVGVTALRYRALPTLSGGERQRVLIARALAQEAPVLLLDEPSAALDIGRQMELMALLAELHAEGRTILAALHDLRLAMEFFPRAILLHEGRLVAEGATATVLVGPHVETAYGVRIERREDFCFRLLSQPCVHTATSEAHS
jgi:iron complex transport system ATP-binding protein